MKENEESIEENSISKKNEEYIVRYFFNKDTKNNVNEILKKSFLLSLGEEQSNAKKSPGFIPQF